MTDEIEFVDGLPIPPVDTTHPWRFPFQRLAIGGAFIVRNFSVRRMSAYKQYAQRRLNRRFVLRQMKNKVDVGVWRTE